MSKNQVRSRDEGTSKRQQQLKERREKGKARERRKKVTGFIAIVIGAALFVGILVYPNLQPLDLASPPPTEHPMADMNSMGDPNAPVHIVEYSSFTCSHCRNFYVENEPMLIQEYIKTGKVYFTYIPYVSAQDTNGLRAAEASFCAGDQGSFWEMHDVIFSNFDYYVQNQGFSPRSLSTMAENLGLDMDAFENCMDSNKHRDTLLGLAQEGSQAGVNVTPTFLVNGITVIGNDPDSLIREIELILATLANRIPILL